MSLKIFIFSMSAAEETIDTLFLFVQALMPSEYFPKYKSEMEAAFGLGSCRALKLG